MRVVLQRVTRASVRVSGEVVGAIGPGLCILVGVTHTDTEADADRLADKVWGLRILEGERSASDENAPLLVISQFTLYADVRKGRRPSWSAASRLSRRSSQPCAAGAPTSKRDASEPTCPWNSSTMAP